MGEGRSIRFRLAAGHRTCAPHVRARSTCGEPGEVKGIAQPGFACTARLAVLLPGALVTGHSLASAACAYRTANRSMGNPWVAVNLVSVSRLHVRCTSVGRTGTRRWVDGINEIPPHVSFVSRLVYRPPWGSP